MTTSENDEQLIRQTRAGDRDALGALLAQHRTRLTRMVRLRMDPRVAGRVNPSDVLQDAFLEASQRIKEYLDHPEVPFFVWLRFLTGQRLSLLHRRHLGAQARNADREMSIHQATLPDANSGALAAKLVSKLTSPSIAARRSEMKKHLEEALNSLSPFDREIIALRNYEQVSNVEASEILQLTPSATSNRYLRALERLREVLSASPGLSGEV
jgi:RNA polymerase sigma-70 factor (ECF subfamily)